MFADTFIKQILKINRDIYNIFLRSIHRFDDILTNFPIAAANFSNINYESINSFYEAKFIARYDCGDINAMEYKFM